MPLQQSCQELDYTRRCIYAVWFVLAGCVLAIHMEHCLLILDAVLNNKDPVQSKRICCLAMSQTFYGDHQKFCLFINFISRIFNSFSACRIGISIRKLLLNCWSLERKENTHKNDSFYNFIKWHSVWNTFLLHLTCASKTWNWHKQLK